METKFTARNERVYNGEKMIASIWAEYPSKECLPGESWMQMMDRTEGAREKATQDTFDRARLFAAAPELLEALILLEREMVESGNAESRDYGWKPAIEKTRAAIAKATGVQA